MRQFVTEAVARKVKMSPASQTPWMKLFASGRICVEKAQQISKAIEEAFEEVDHEMFAPEDPKSQSE